MNILVIGANGNTGKKVIQKLNETDIHLWLWFEKKNK